MRIVTPDQHSAAWLHARRGLVTASRVREVFSFLKKGERKGAETKERHRYKRELALERITGVCTPHYVSPDMDFGSQYEHMARGAYERLTGTEIDRTGFILHPTIDKYGCSPDGLVDGQRGCVEFKVPRLDNHLDWLEEDEVPEEHVDQCMSVTTCTEYDWCDFVSYSPPVDDEYAHPSVRDPRRPVLPERMQLFIKRVPRDDKRIAEMEYGVVEFLAEVDAMVKRLGGETPQEALRAALRSSVRQDGPLQDEGFLTDDDLPQSWRERMAEE